MPEATAPSAPSILILEDEWLIAEATARAVQRLGYRPLGPVHTVAEALDILAAEMPDAALVDTILRGESCLPVADRLLEAGIPFSFVSGFQLADLPSGYAGCRLLAKPYAEPQLAATLRALLPPRRGHRPAEATLSAAP
ncbi:MAG TPA: response regulator [Roseomonas sp.]|jgi:DNA-binding response OmpR family regulator